MGGSRRQGSFITFEGVDGTGKSTQVKLLRDYLEKQGIPCLFVREPGSTTVGEHLRDILLHHADGRTPETEALLYAAARAQLVREKIIPSLQRGLHVICDRYVDSSLAYQSFGLGLSLDFVRSINAVAIKEAIPDLTVLLHLSNGKRHGSPDTTDRIETRDRQFHDRVRQGYLSLASNEPNRFVVVDAAPSVEEVQMQIRKLVLARLGIS